MQILLRTFYQMLPWVQNTIAFRVCIWAFYSAYGNLDNLSDGS